jgi:hypothetical protein
VPTLADRILEELRVVPAGLDDDELAARLGVVRQAVNQACRKLAVGGALNRGIGSTGKILNTLDRTWQPTPKPLRTTPGDSVLMTEDEVKGAVRKHLVSEGYRVRVAWAREHGIDIEAKRTSPASRLVIEAKGEAALQPQQANYFLGALGELVQRMGDPHARYGLALPDNRQFRGRVQRLPKLAWARLNLTVFFVKRLHDAYEVEVLSGDGEELTGNGARRPDDRPRCAACGEPVVLDDPADPDSWIHAPDANDRADHTAWIDESSIVRGRA